MTKLRFFSMGSGSSGNCYYIGTNEYGFLIDAGVSVRTVKRGLKDNNISFENIWGIFITHDHTDHIKSAGVLGEQYHIPVYATKEMHQGINRNYRVTQKLITCQKLFKKGEHITIRDFSIQSFPVSHDASDCVGYTFTFNHKRFVLVTDLGYINKEASDHIVKADYLVIEANYDEKMLNNGKYPYPLKQRVRGHLGHLSNDHTAQFLGANQLPNLSHLFLCHLSGENNTHDKAYQTVHDALTEAQKAQLEVLHPLERIHCSELFTFDTNANK